MSTHASPASGPSDTEWQPLATTHGHKSATRLVVAGQLAEKQPMLQAVEYAVLALCTMGAIGVVLFR